MGTLPAAATLAQSSDQVLRSPRLYPMTVGLDMVPEGVDADHLLQG